MIPFTRNPENANQCRVTESKSVRPGHGLLEGVTAKSTEEKLGDVLILVVAVISWVDTSPKSLPIFLYLGVFIVLIMSH